MIKGLTNHIFCKVMKKRGVKAIRHLDETSKNAVAVNKELLFKLLRDNSDTEYGKKCGFADIKSVEEFKEKVPFSTYDDYAEDIHKMIYDDSEGLFTNYPIIHYALSSGSVGVPKYIPVSQMTMDLYCAYCANLSFGLMDEYYRNTTGKSFPDGYCLNTLESPPMVTENGVPMGSISGSLLRPLADQLRHFITSPSEVIFPEESMDMKYLKVRFALPERNVICIIAPFMSAPVDLMRYIENNWEMLCDDIEKGIINEDINVSQEIRSRIMPSIKPDKVRADELREEFKKGFDDPIIPRIWKNFSFVASIGTGGFSQYTLKMRQYTGKNIPYSFQNYAASEAIMAVERRTGEESFALLPEGAFYEFIPVDSEDEETTLTIDQLEAGKDYEIVITNLSGFYRYRLKDVIRVTGFYNETPFIQFLYRKNQMLSVAGEKTNEEAVRWAITKFQDDTGILVRDYSVYADLDSNPGRYIMIMEPDKKIDPDKLGEYRDIIERRIGEANPSFGSKISSGVIGRTKLCITQQETYMLYRDMMIANGVSQNQIKPVRVIDTPIKEKFFFRLFEYEAE